MIAKISNPRLDNLFAEKINRLRKLHSELDIEISKIVEVIPVDQIMLQRIKKKKLKLKDEISKLSSQILPDIIA